MAIGIATIGAISALVLRAACIFAPLIRVIHEKTAPHNPTGHLLVPPCLPFQPLWSATAAAEVPDIPGWELVWQDEFDGNAVSEENWDVLTRRNSFNNEKQYYRPRAGVDRRRQAADHGDQPAARWQAVSFGAAGELANIWARPL